MIPPFLGFYAKVFVIHSLSYSNLTIAILAILCSVISCVRYLSLIQVSNFKMFSSSSNLTVASAPLVHIDSIKSYILSFFTIFLSLSFLSPIYLMSTISYLIL